MRRAVVTAVMFSVLLSALSLSATAQPQNTFYLHDQYVLDGNAPTQTAPKSIGLGGPLRYFNWTTAAFSSDQSYPAGNWNVTLWMNVTTTETQYRVRLVVHNQSGDFELSHAYTPFISTPSPTEYEVTMALSAFTIRSGESLVLGLLRQFQTGAASHTAFIFFDSASAASRLNGPVATTTTITATTMMTTTQQTTTTTSQQATTTTTSSTAAITSQLSQSMFYLHAVFLLDQSARTATTPNVLALTGGQYYVWKTVSFPAEQSFPSATWIATVWLSIPLEPTQYRLALGVVNSTGAFIDRAHSFTPIITSPSPVQYDVNVSVEAFNAGAGESLAIGFLRQWQNGSYSPAAYLYFDSQAMPSSLKGPSISTTTSLTTVSTTTAATTTQMTTITHITTSIAQVGAGSGFGFAVIAIGAGVSAVGAGVAFAVSGRSPPYSEVFAYGGYYYCRKHRVPVWYVQGWLWCPVERRYLRP